MRLRSLLPVLCAASLLAADSSSPLPDVAQLLVDIIRVDTSNPPGNEDKLAQLLAAKFRPYGFEIDIIPTPQAGKSHFIARLRGNGSRKPVLLAAHADVVGVEREKWSVDPFAGVVKDGAVWGRGAIDFKGGLAVFAQAVLNIAKSKVPLDRDIIFLSEADEEGGQYNTRFLATKAWDKIDCEFALNEGGWIIKDDKGKVLYVSISTADKSGVSLKLTARGTSTHSSMPRPDNAIYTLARALVKISEYDTKPKLTESTREFFMALSQTNPEPMKSHFRNLAEGKNPQLVAAADKAISENTLLHAIMRNTIAPVLMNAGFRGNVIPGSAEVTLNFRTIPGTTPEELIEEMNAVVGDPRVEITQATMGVVCAPLTPQQLKDYERLRNMPESSKETDLYRALVASSKKTYPTAVVTPYLFQAGTDAFAWRSQNIPVYGIYPYPIDAADLSRMHGNDERVPISSLQTGVSLITDTLLAVAARK